LRKPFTKRRDWLEERGLYKPTPEPRAPRARGKRKRAKEKPAPETNVRAFDWKAHYRGRMINAARTHARTLGVAFDLKPSDIYIPDVCPVFGTPLRPNIRNGYAGNGDAPSLDRILPNEGYVRWNIAVISWRANRIKSDLSSRDFFALAAWLKHREKYAKRGRTVELNAILNSHPLSNPSDNLDPAEGLHPEIPSAGPRVTSESAEVGVSPTGYMSSIRQRCNYAPKCAR
jgi:hypothetical protein